MGFFVMGFLPSMSRGAAILVIRAPFRLPQATSDRGTQSNIVVASGDRDFIPLVNIAKEVGWTVEMAAFKSAYSKAGEMAKAVDKIRPLDDVFDKLGSCTRHIPRVCSYCCARGCIGSGMIGSITNEACCAS